MKKKRHTPALAYPAGYFTALMREANWPPGFEAALDLGGANAQRQRAASAAREAAAANGTGWGNGTIPMANTPKNPMPKMMARAAA